MAFRIALIGNPNCGKTTLFNNLTGASQYVGNWPGVTVEKKEGFLKGNKELKIIDLPGIYSLTPYTDEEIVSKNFLFLEKPDLILNVVSAVNLERSLYLTLQLLELNIPVVVAISMMDKIEKNRGFIDFGLLSKMLNCKVVKLVPMDESSGIFVVNFALDFLKSGGNNLHIKYSENFEQFVNEIKLNLNGLEKQKRFLAIKFLEGDESFLSSFKLRKEEKIKIRSILFKAKDFFKEETKTVLINERYFKINEIVELCSKKLNKSFNVSDKIDSVLTNKFLAFPIFILILGCAYFVCINLLGKPMSNFLENVLKQKIVPFVVNFLKKTDAAVWLKSLIVDGIISGVGTIMTFIPQVFMLFLFLSILEDCGYMARVAFILDKLFLKFGFCGKSVISFLLSSGCGVNGIMATKTIKDKNIRFLTIVATTFVPCNAKLPIIAVICSYVFNGSFLTAILIYLISFISIFILGFVLRKINKKNIDHTAFIMELGPYNLPNFKNTIYYTIINVKAFIVKAGSIIFLASILIWFLLNFGISSKGILMVEEEKSLLAQFGRLLTTFFKPLGFGNWKAIVATLSGIFAKENLVNTFSVILKSAENSKQGFNLGEVFSCDFAAFSFLLFNMLCAPCFAAIAAIYKQTLSLKYTLKILFFQTVFSYITAFLIYQIGGLFFKQVSFSFYSILAFFSLFLVFVLFIFQFKENKKTV